MLNFARSLIQRHKIPKPFRAPRPMAFEKDRSRLSARAKLEITALVLATSVAAIAPLRGADDEARELSLRAAASRSPSSHVLVVHASPEVLRDGTCTKALGALNGLVELGHARGVLLVSPLDVLCGNARSPAIQPLPKNLLRTTARGAVLGFTAPGPDQAALKDLGLTEARWVVPVPETSVPSISLADLVEERTPLSVASGRVVVAALDAQSEPGRDPSSPTVGTQVAAALGGLLDGGVRREAPVYASGLSAALAILILMIARRLFAIRGAIIALVACLLIAIAGQAIAASSLERGLLPGASMIAAILAGAIVALSLDLSGWKRAVARTNDLLGREGIFRRVQTEPDGVFWPRLGRLAARLHAADFVLVAELPSGQWHLRFWDDGDMGEHLVGERRRDIRRQPFVNEQGVAAIHVTDKFLKNDGVPTIVVPLIALGEIEGYLFFCGEKAKAAYAGPNAPERLERLAKEFALIARRRRLGGQAEGEGAPSTPRLLDAPVPLSDRLIQRADVAAKDLQAFGEVLRSSPVGLLYADALGDVRMMSRDLTRWLQSRGVSVPPDAVDGALPPGSIGLAQVLVAITGSSPEDASNTLAEVLQSDTGVTCRSQGSSGPAFALTIRALRQKADGFASIAGYVASAIEQPEERPTNVRALSTAPTLDPLSAFPLSDLIAHAATGATRATGRQPKIEPLRAQWHVIGHRIALERALEAFLSEVAAQSPAGQPPVITVRETSSMAVEVSILDWSLGFGLPESALQRVLIAPGAAPAGLEVLGRLIMSIEDSHGTVQIRSEDGWGLTLVVSLPRARPRMKMTMAEGSAQAPDNVVALGRNTAK